MPLDRLRFKREAEEELKKRGMSKTELAKEIGSSTKSVQNTLWMPIDHLTPTVRKIAEALELDISYLPKLERNKDKKPKANNEPIITEKARSDGTVIRITKIGNSEKIELLHPEDLEIEKKEKEKAKSMIDDRDEFLKMNDDRKLERNSNKLEKELERQEKIISDQETRIAILKKEKIELLEKTKYLKDLENDLDNTYAEKEELQKKVNEMEQRLNELESKAVEQEKHLDISDKVMDLSIGSALKLKEALEGVLK